MAQDKMKLEYISNGDPERIPPIGTEFDVAEHIKFRVEAYRESVEIDYPGSPTGKAYKLELLGCLVLEQYFRMKPTEKLVRVEFPDGAVLYVPEVK